MYLPPSGVDYYTLTITTTPPLSGWEASFDGGTTWIAGVLKVGTTDTWQWLLAGPQVAVPGSAHVIPNDLEPLIRAVSNPQVFVRKAPYIALTIPTT